MKLYIVIDNNPSETSPALESEHGLCIYFNSCGENFLIDTGSSGKFISNLENLNLTKIEDIEHVIISHGHNDHTGGLKDFLILHYLHYLHLFAQVGISLLRLSSAFVVLLR